MTTPTTWWCPSSARKVGTANSGVPIKTTRAIFFHPFQVARPGRIHGPGGLGAFLVFRPAGFIGLAAGVLLAWVLTPDYQVMVDGKLMPANHTFAKFWREVEIFPLIRLKSYRLGQLFFVIFHPKKAWYYFRQGQL